jgi:Ni/Co efflux regulator RcnB
MKTMILALAAVATLGMAVPASAQSGAPRGTAVNKVSSQDFSSRHRHWHRHHRHCTTFWRHGRRVTVCR